MFVIFIGLHAFAFIKLGIFFYTSFEEVSIYDTCLCRWLDDKMFNNITKEG